MNEQEVRRVVLEVLCPLPTASDARAFNQDLGAMSHAERWRERERVRQRLLVDPSPSPWLFGRLDALDSVEITHAN